jgi:hypothetical protein
MGVLYHRRSPLEHLWQLKDQLVSGGELVLETLVIEGDENAVLVPGDRYAQMRNVYFIPSALALKNWLEVRFCRCAYCRCERDLNRGAAPYRLDDNRIAGAVPRPGRPQ